MFTLSMTVAGAVGLLLVAVVWYRRRNYYPGSEHQLAFPVELAGIVWVMVGAVADNNQSNFGAVGRICAITVLIALGAAELVVGLSISKQDLWRRISGLCCIILAIFICVSAGEGVFTLVGSLIAIALAVMVFYAQQYDQTEIGNDASGRTVELQGVGEGA